MPSKHQVTALLLAKAWEGRRASTEHDHALDANPTGHRTSQTPDHVLVTDDANPPTTGQPGCRLTGHLIDEEHSALGEQIGVERLYFVRDLSEEEDVLRACLRALARTSQALAEAHNRLGAQYEPATDEDVLGEGRLAEITVLLESDLDPTAPYRWGWLEPSEEDGHERD